MSLKRKLQYLTYLAKSGRYKTINNYMWVYPLWHSSMKKLWLNKVLPSMGIDMYPPFIEIEPTTRCNHRCLMCEHTYWGEPGRDMSFNEFKMIVDQFPNLKWAGLSGIGASLVNKDFLRMVKYLKETSNPMIELVDTFFLMDGEAAQKVVDSDVDIYFISMCGATAKTYNKVMAGSDFDTVVANLKRLAALKKERATRLPILNLHYIVNSHNIHEMEDFLDLVHSLDIGQYEVLYSPLLHSFNEVNGLVVDIPDELIARVRKKAEELDILIDFNCNMPKVKPPVSNCVQWIMPFIFVTGHVIPCCAANEINQRGFQKEHSMGNVFEKSFRDIWYGEKFIEFRQKIRRGEAPIQCRNCTIYDVTGCKG